MNDRLNSSAYFASFVFVIVYIFCEGIVYSCAHMCSAVLLQRNIRFFFFEGRGRGGILRPISTAYVIWQVIFCSWKREEGFEAFRPTSLAPFCLHHWVGIPQLWATILVGKMIRCVLWSIPVIWGGSLQGGYELVHWSMEPIVSYLLDQ